MEVKGVKKDIEGSQHQGTGVAILSAKLSCPSSNHWCVVFRTWNNLGRHDVVLTVSAVAEHYEDRP